MECMDYNNNSYYYRFDSLSWNSSIYLPKKESTNRESDYDKLIS